MTSIIGKLKKINLEREIDEVFDLFSNVERAIDLCAAPGSWSQVLSKKLSQKGLFPSEKIRIVSVDLQEMAPIENVVQVQGDITKKETVDTILQKFEYQHADLIVCDGAPDVTGFHDIDQYIQSQLIVAALNICLMSIKQNGTFVAKIFKGSDVNLLYSQFKLFFNQVYFTKPKSSRQSSVENFIVFIYRCLQFQPPFSLTKFHLYTFQSEIQKQEEEFTKIQTTDQLEQVNSKEKEKYFKFLTCGDLSGFDE